MEGVLLIASKLCICLYSQQCDLYFSCIWICVLSFRVPTLSAGVYIWWELLAVAYFWLCRWHATHQMWDAPTADANIRRETIDVKYFMFFCSCCIWQHEKYESRERYF